LNSPRRRESSSGIAARFPTATQDASWIGVSPGHDESAGSRKSGKSRKGNRWWRATLIECARGAARARRRDLAVRYHRMARRRGDRKAIAAVEHSILVAAWHILRDWRRVPRARLQPLRPLRSRPTHPVSHPPTNGPWHPRARCCTAIGSRRRYRRI
jgi:hypothetical protein